MAQTKLQHPQESAINWLQLGIALVITLGAAAGAYSWLMYG